jgi:hypothetical protein
MVHWREIILLLPFVACTPGYAMDRPGTSNASLSHTNDANLRTMLVNPHDLVAGVGEDTSIGPEAALPVARLIAGKRKELPASNAATFQFVGAPEGGGGGATGP